MPELPEVEHAARTLEAAVRGNRIERLRLLHPSLGRRLPTDQAARLSGRVVLRVERRGKHQLLHLDDGSVLHVHFRMTGDWEIGQVTKQDAPFARAVLDFDDGTRVSLIDPRALATLALHDSASTLPELGPEPSDAAFTAEALGAAFARRRGPIKPALLDQRI